MNRSFFNFSPHILVIPCQMLQLSSLMCWLFLVKGIISRMRGVSKLLCWGGHISEDNTKIKIKTTVNYCDIHLSPSTFVVMKIYKAPSIYYKYLTLIMDCFKESMQNY